MSRGNNSTPTSAVEREKSASRYRKPRATTSVNAVMNAKLLEYVPELSDREYVSITLLSNYCLNVIDVLLSRSDRFICDGRCEDDFGKLVKRIEQNKKTEYWKITPRSPLVLFHLLNEPPKKEDSGTKKASIACYGLREGVLEISHEKMKKRLWYVASHGNNEYKNKQFSKRFVYEEGDNDILTCFIEYCQEVLREEYDALKPNDTIRVVNTYAKHQISDTAVKQPLYISEEVQHDLLDDFSFFLQNKEWFVKNCVPYKRGYLLVGPPGNGKTSLIRKIASTPGITAFSFDFRTEESSKNSDLIDAFATAVQHAPAIFIMEDIDRIFEEIESKSFITKDTLFNCLDGLTSREGIVVVATANNPGLLDKALLKRPGRFDRVIRVGLPDRKLRHEMLTGLFSLNAENTVDSDTIDSIADATAEFSMAALKEIYIASAGKALFSHRPGITSGDALEGFSIVCRQFKDKTDVRVSGFSR